MGIGIWFWVIYVICILIGGWASWPFTRQSAAPFVVWVLIFLLGWGVFGPPIHG